MDIKRQIMSSQPAALRETEVKVEKKNIAENRQKQNKTENQEGNITEKDLKKPSAD